jgi:O-Antigen ligase
MELFRNQSLSPGLGSSDTLRPLAWMVGLLSVLLIVVVASIAPTMAGLIILSGWAVLIWVAISFLRAQFHYVVLTWVAVFPYCYYFFSYPAERAIFTVDRAFILLLVIGMFVFLAAGSAAPLPRDVRISAWFWASYLLVCFHSLAGRPVFDVLSSYRLILDGLLMPAFLGMYAIRFFPITHNLNRLHTCVCVLMLGIALVCGLELVRGKNLLPWPGAIETWVQTDEVTLIRVDGPFENTSILCVVGMLGFFFLIYTRRLIGASLTGGRWLLHSAGLLASLASALLPMNRGLVVAFLVCALIDYLAKDSLVSRRVWNCMFAALLFVALVGKLFYPGLFEDRVTRSDNFYQRIAQDLQTAEVVRDHPLMGVGFGLYEATVLGDPKYAVQWQGIEAMNVPHNSLLSVLAEEGSVGFLLYLGAQLYLVRAMWRLRKVNKLGFQVFLYCILAYTIVGFDVGLAYYSDLNLLYMFVLGTILQIQLHMLLQEPFSHGLCER